MLSILYIIKVLFTLDLDITAIPNVSGLIAGLCIGIILKTVTVFFAGAAWADWISYFAFGRISRTEAVSVYCKANIGKYLPGNVMHYVNRNIYAVNIGLSQRKIALSSVLEIAEQVISAILLATSVWGGELYQKLTGYVDATFIKASLLLAACLLMLICCFAIKKYREKINSRLLKTILKTFALHMAALIILGGVLDLLYILSWGIMTSPEIQIKIISGYILAWIAGFVVPGAPGGIGIREAVLISFVNPLMGAKAAAVLTVFHRFITVIGDFIAYAAGKILRRMPIK